MKKVAILTTFTSADPAYSLNRVVQDQLTMLVEHGYKPKVLVRQGSFWDNPVEVYANPNGEIVQLPNVPVYNEVKMDETFEEDVKNLFVAIDEALADVDVVITHDIIYQPDGLKFNIASRKVAKQRPNIIWLHWIHSATSPYTLREMGVLKDEHIETLKEKWDNSYPVFFNNTSIPRIATNFGYSETDVKVVPHPTDIISFLGLSDVSARLYKEKKFYDADFVATYPVRLDRGKQVEWVIKIMARLKAMKTSVRVVVMDFHSTGGDKVTYRQELKDLGYKWGLDDTDMTFLSEFDESCRTQSPHSMVREMLSLSNVFILPSKSESYSLVAQEAGIMGNLLIVNDDFTPFREIFGESALYYKFSSNIDRLNNLDGETTTKYTEISSRLKPAEYPESLMEKSGDLWVVPGDALYANDIAMRILTEFKTNKSLIQRRFRMKERNIYAIFNNYLQPLFYLNDGKYGQEEGGEYQILNSTPILQSGEDIIEGDIVSTKPNI
jgi:glycosyltransferase involved in cell wall biosynthesis